MNNSKLIIALIFIFLISCLLYSNESGAATGFSFSSYTGNISGSQDPVKITDYAWTGGQQMVFFRNMAIAGGITAGAGLALLITGAPFVAVAVNIYHAPYYVAPGAVYDPGFAAWAAGVSLMAIGGTAMLIGLPLLAAGIAMYFYLRNGGRLGLVLDGNDKKLTCGFSYKL